MSWRENSHVCEIVIPTDDGLYKLARSKKYKLAIWRTSIMSTLGFIEYENASPEVRAVYDDIMATRKTDKVTNFWKALAHDPVRLKRTWEDTKEIMAAGKLDPLTKELIYVAVSVSNQCDYCIAAHTAAARKKGMTEAIFNEMLAVVGLANQNNRLVAGLQVEIDEQFKAVG
jgi:AhpD family alkylhydroperoxidase